MTYIVLGCGLAILELWTVASQRGVGFYTLPQSIRLLIPALIAVGAFRRPRAERISVGILAVGLGLTLNRDLTGNGVVGHVAVVACGLSAAWFGYCSTTPLPNERPRLLLAILLVVLAFLGVFFTMRSI